MNTAAGHAALSHWLDNRVEDWRAIDRLLGKPSRARTITETRHLMASYRTLARDLALARRELPDDASTRALSALYARLHAEIHAPAASWRDELPELIHIRIPAAFARVTPDLIMIAALFTLATMAGWIGVNVWPESVRLVLGADAIDIVKAGGLWTDSLHGVVPASELSWSIMSNNVMVTIWAMLLGLFFGFGTLYIISVNGVMLGAVFAFTGRYGLADELGRFVIAHGLVEISIILLGGALGSRLGRALARPGAVGRIASLRAESEALTPLLAVAIPFLIGSGIIEGYVSPHPDIGWPVRIMVGVAWMALFVIVLLGRLPRWSLTYPRPHTR